MVGARLAQRGRVVMPGRDAHGRAVRGVGGLDVERRVSDDEDVRVRDVAAEHRLAALHGAAHDPRALDAGGGVRAEGEPAYEIAARELHEGRAVAVAGDEAEQVAV